MVEKEELPPGDGWAVIRIPIQDILRLLKIEPGIVQDVHAPHGDEFGRLDIDIRERCLLVKVNHPAFPRVPHNGGRITYFELDEARQQTTTMEERFGLPDPLDAGPKRAT